jgi:CheY-like chemotaxis protein
MEGSTQKSAAPILVVDDSPAALLVLQRILSTINCSILTACSGVQAIEVCRHNPLACILMDVNMS